MTSLLTQPHCSVSGCLVLSSALGILEFKRCMCLHACVCVWMLAYVNTLQLSRLERQLALDLEARTTAESDERRFRDLALVNYRRCLQVRVTSTYELGAESGRCF